MTIPRKKKSTPLEDFANIAPEQCSVKEEAPADDLDIRKLDIFAMFASIGVAKKMDDAAQIAHESYQIGFKMMELSELYKDWKK